MEQARGFDVNGGPAISHTTGGAYEGFMPGGSTPLDGDPTVTVENPVVSLEGSLKGKRLVTATDVDKLVHSPFSRT